MSMNLSQYCCCLEAAKSFLYVANKMTTAIIDLRSPYIVNLSITCELFLKAIAIKKNPSSEYKHIHELGNLLNELPTQDKAAICSLFQKKAPNIKLDDFLQTCNCPFIDWRYEFEHKSLKINIQALADFAEVLNTYCDTL